MSEEQLKAFLEKVKSDTSLQDKLMAATDADAVAGIAKEAGFIVSVDDLKRAESEVSDDELEAAAGGGANTQTVACQTCVMSNPCNTYNSTCMMKDV